MKTDEEIKSDIYNHTGFIDFDAIEMEWIIDYILSIRKADREAVVKMIEELLKPVVYELDGAISIAEGKRDAWNSALSLLKEKLQ